MATDISLPLPPTGEITDPERGYRMLGEHYLLRMRLSYKAMQNQPDERRSMPRFVARASRNGTEDERRRRVSDGCKLVLRIERLH